MNAVITFIRRRSLIAVCTVAAAAIIIAGAALYHRVSQRVKQEKQEDLAAVTGLKVNQIGQWRRERYGDAYVLAQSPIFAAAVRRWFMNPGDELLREEIYRRLDAFKIYGTYKSIILIDRQGRIRLALKGLGTDTLSAATARMLGQAEKTRKIIFSDFYYCDVCRASHLDLIAPLYSEGDYLGTLILRIEPETYLYPLIQSWPIPSKTSETFIVRREGDSVLFLNELRYRKNTAMKLRLPLSDSSLPAVLAALGREGMVEGRDYRGVKVLAVIRKIPDSPWFMVAKVDAKEIYRPVRNLAYMFGFSALALLTMAGLAAGFLWQGRQRRHYQELHQAELERQALTRHFDYLTKYANDIVILAGEDGRIVDVNDRALSAYGYGRKELTGKNVRELWNGLERDTLPEQLKKARERDGLRFETVHQRKDGTAFPVEASIRPMEVEGRKFYQNIVRDITERNQAEADLKKLNRELAAIKQCNQIMIRATDEQKLLDDICRIVVEEAGYRFAWVGIPEQDEGKTVRPAAFRGYEAGYLKAIKITWSEDEHGQGPTGTAVRTGKTSLSRDISTDPQCQTWREQALARGYRSSIALPVVYGGAMYGALNIYSAEADAFKEAEVKLLEELAGDLAYGITFLRNARARNRSQKELRESEEQYRTIIEHSNDMIWTLDAEGRFLFFNKRSEEISGYKMDEWLGKSFEPLIKKEDFPRVVEVFKKTMSGQPQQYEVSVKRSDGSELILSVNTAPIYSKGELAGTVSFGQDITERKRAEEALRRKEKHHRIVIENIFKFIPEGVLVLAESLDPLTQNKAFGDMVEKYAPLLGYTEQELAGKIIEQLRVKIATEETAEIRVTKMIR